MSGGQGSVRASAEGPVYTSKPKKKGVTQTKTFKLLEAHLAEIDWRSLAMLKHLDINGFNQAAEKAFLKLVLELLAESGRDEIPLMRVLQECSFGLDLSVPTIKRYVIKHTARRAELRYFNKAIGLNPYYKVPVEDEQKPDDETEEDGHE